MALWVCCANARAVRAERSLVAPRSEAPAELSPGGTLSVWVDVATGLTPPPGIQEDRALRLFAIALCADGVDLGGGERRCFPLAVRNLRPSDGGSLRYRVDAPVPIWVAPWRYDLEVRFPGGQASAARALIVRSSPDDRFELAPALEHSAAGAHLPAGGQGSGLVRVHVGPAGLALSGARFRGFPLPDAVRGFAPGFVALVQREGIAPVAMTKRQGESTFALSMAPAEAEAGRALRLSGRGVPPGARLFWWLDPARGALGSEVTTVFLQRGRASLQLLAVGSDGRFGRAQAVLPIWQRRAFGCALAAPGRPPIAAGEVPNWPVMLGIWLSALGCCRGGARFAIAAARVRGAGVSKDAIRAVAGKGSGGRG